MRRSTQRTFLFSFVSLAAALAAWWSLSAQPSAAPRGGNGEEPQQIVIERRPLALRDPQTFQVSLRLEPARFVTLVAAGEGFVKKVSVDPGEDVDAQAEIVRLDDAVEHLRYEGAKARLEVAQIDVEWGRRKQSEATGDGASGEWAFRRAEAASTAAKADLELARLAVERTVVRAAFAGRIYRVLAAVGGWVRAGEPLATLGDPGRLSVEIPVERSRAAVGQPIAIRVEEQHVDAVIESILPLSERFEPIRALVPSAVSAAVVVDNARGRFHAGQTVYCPLIPREPVTEVPTASLSNSSDGTRKVQVLRGQRVRDVPVQLLGPVGVDRLFVSGAFAAGDELIVGASQALTDGTRLRPTAGGAETERPAVAGPQRKDELTPRPSISRF